MTEDEMVGWDHRFNGHEFEQALGDSEGQESLACCSPWGCKESDILENPRDGGAWWAAVSGVAQSWTRHAA